MQTATVEIRFSSRSILESFFLGLLFFIFILACQGLGLLHSTGFEVPARVLKGLSGEICNSSQVTVLVRVLMLVGVLLLLFNVKSEV